MSVIPFDLRLKKKFHRDIAYAQDLIVKEIFNVFDDAVMHDGTAIWRCFNGGRFSEDIDVYMIKDEGGIDRFFSNIKSMGFTIKKRKTTDNSLCSKLEMNGTEVRFECVFKKVEGALTDYVCVDGNIVSIFSLTAEEFILEKISAYKNRKKIRDLYDIFHLLKYVGEKEKISKGIKNLISSFEKPVDEENLKVLVYEGVAPSSEKMVEYIMRW